MNEPTGFLIFYVREARKKSKTAALQEALCLLQDLNPIVPVSGPLAEQGGVFWLRLPEAALDEVEGRLPFLGYTYRVDMLELQKGGRLPGRQSPLEQYVQWQKQRYRLVPLYEEDKTVLHEPVVDRWEFGLESDGGGRKVKGYRGGGTVFGRRGLPVADARLLVNLVRPLFGRLSHFLDPFAGAGGVVLAALGRGWRVFSCDWNWAGRPGLAGLGVMHTVADGGRLPFAAGAVDGIATELPHDPQVKQTVLAALVEMGRVLRQNGRLALLCAGWQAEELRRVGQAQGLELFLDCAVDRKGTAWVLLAWEKK